MNSKVLKVKKEIKQILYFTKKEKKWLLYITNLWKILFDWQKEVLFTYIDDYKICTFIFTLKYSSLGGDIK